MTCLYELSSWFIVAIAFSAWISLHNNILWIFEIILSSTSIIYSRLVSVLVRKAYLNSDILEIYTFSKYKYCYFKESSMLFSLKFFKLITEVFKTLIGTPSKHLNMPWPFLLLAQIQRTLLFPVVSKINLLNFNIKMVHRNKNICPHVFYLWDSDRNKIDS